MALSTRCLVSSRIQECHAPNGPRTRNVVPALSLLLLLLRRRGGLVLPSSNSLANSSANRGTGPRRLRANGSRERSVHLSRQAVNVMSTRNGDVGQAGRQAGRRAKQASRQPSRRIPANRYHEWARVSALAPNPPPRAVRAPLKLSKSGRFVAERAEKVVSRPRLATNRCWGPVGGATSERLGGESQPTT